MNLKLTISMKILTTLKKIFDFFNYSTKSKYYGNSKELVFYSIKNETAWVAIRKFVRLKPNKYSYLADDNSKHKKANGVNKNVVAAVSYNEYIDVNCFCINTKYTSKTVNVMGS